MVAILARYASRFSVRALDLTVDSSMVWVGAGLALVAAALLAFVPRLAIGGSSTWIRPSSGSLRIAGGTRRRQQIFAVTQIAACFVLLAGAAMLLKTLLALQAVPTGFDTRHVLAINVPVMSYGRTAGQVGGLLQRGRAPHRELPGVDGVAIGILVPWREAGSIRSRVPIFGGRLRSGAWRRRSPRAASGRVARDFSPRSACRCSPAATSTISTGRTASRL